MSQASLIKFLCLLAAFFIVATGCVEVRSNISNKGSPNTTFTTNQIYRVVRPLFVFVTTSGIKSKLRLEVLGRNQNGPDSVQEFEAGNKKGWPSLLGIVPAKTRLTITKLELVKNPDFGSYVVVNAEFIEGEFATRTADITFLLNRESLIVPKLDTNNLELLRP
jgi:hypothetical protein